LSTRSEQFRGLWATHQVRPLTTGSKRFRHPEVGDLDLGYEYLHIAADEGLMILTYVAQPGTASHDGLRLLGSLAVPATPDQHTAPASRRAEPASAGDDA
jgi:hypothetical protein